ncbi:ion transporter [Paenibacillus eucommiae]|uniref:Membrane protein n=1 Tax=Paenibacillus eucommiae TaxID=1355755 RepID=A0ABS4J4H8_9BACL|nr:ion transporter [Paenibacillus eucommiae]MBP1994141.1 putative membrane protein [Paenibacillus eucommiae]
MERSYYKKWYLIVSFILSLYLVLVTILGFTSVSKEIKAPFEAVAHYILWFFIIELVVLFFAAKDIRTFFKEQWLSILAVGTSFSITQFMEAVVGIGSLTGVKALKGLKSLKTLKSLKSIKLFKATKSVKAAKSYKIGKKASKAVKEMEMLEKESL